MSKEMFFPKKCSFNHKHLKERCLKLKSQKKCFKISLLRNSKKAFCPLNLFLWDWISSISKKMFWNVLKYLKLFENVWDVWKCLKISLRLNLKENVWKLDVWKSLTFQKNVLWILNISNILEKMFYQFEISWKKMFLENLKHLKENFPLKKISKKMLLQTSGFNLSIAFSWRFKISNGFFVLETLLHSPTRVVPVASRQDVRMFGRTADGNLGVRQDEK